MTSDHSSRARTLGLIGALVTAAAAVGLTAAGYYFDATGGGPSTGLQLLLWGGLLAGFVLLTVGLVGWLGSR